MDQKVSIELPNQKITKRGLDATHKSRIEVAKREGKEMNMVIDEIKVGIKRKEITIKGINSKISGLVDELEEAVAEKIKNKQWILEAKLLLDRISDD